MAEQLPGWIFRNRTLRAIYVLVDNLDRHHATLAASAMAFDAFLSLVPLAAFAGYVFAHLHETGDLVLRPILKTAPGPVRALVDEAFLRLSDTTSAALAPLSLGAFLWVSSSGLSTAMSIFETVFHSPPRTWWWRRLIAMVCVIGTVAVLAVVVAAAILIMTVSGSLGTRAIAVAVPLAVVLGTLSAFFRIAIRGPRPRVRRILPGAVATTTLWTAVSTAFSFYVSTLARYATLYGGLAAVAIFLFWLWLLSLALLVGGEINAQLEGVREPGALNSQPPSSGTAAALFTPLPLPQPPLVPTLPLFREAAAGAEDDCIEREAARARDGKREADH
jgi:membrane protein